MAAPSPGRWLHTHGHSRNPPPVVSKISQECGDNKAINIQISNPIGIPINNADCFALFVAYLETIASLLGFSRFECHKDEIAPGNPLKTLFVQPAAAWIFAKE